MPILQFLDVKQNRQTYDFTDMSLCRLAAIYISFREISQNIEADEEIQQNANVFAGYFQALQGVLNEFATYKDAFMANVKANHNDGIVAHINIEHALRDLIVITLQLIDRVTVAKLQLMLGTANQYLIDNILHDLNRLLSILQEQNTKFINIDHKVVNLRGYIGSLQYSDFPLLLELRDFLNVYLDDPIHKPKASLPGVVVNTAREFTRIGASFLGAVLDTTARAVGVDAQLQSTNAWLQSWNDKHKPLELSGPKPVM